MIRRTLAAINCLGAFACAVLLSGCAPRPEELLERWIAQAGLDPRVAFPPLETDGAALHFEEVAGRLGIELSPPERTGRPHPSHWGERSDPGWAELRDYVQAVRNSQPALSPPTAELAALLAEARPVLHELADLLGLEPLRWERTVEDPLADATSLSGRFRLHRLFLASALEAASLGDREGAGGWLEAGWRLRQSFDDHPLLLDRIIALAMLRSEVSVLLALPWEPPGWRDRLAALEPREEAEVALRLESWRRLRSVAEGGSLRQERGGLRGFGDNVWARYEARAFMETVERVLAHFREADMSAFDSDRFAREQHARIPRWYPTIVMLLPNFWDFPTRALRAELEAELALRALELRELLGEDESAALAALPAQRPSKARGIAWLYDISPGWVVIRASHDPAPHPHDPRPLEVRLPRRR